MSYNKNLQMSERFYDINDSMPFTSMTVQWPQDDKDDDMRGRPFSEVMCIIGERQALLCTHRPYSLTGVCGQGMSNVFAAPSMKYFVIFFRLSIPNPNRNPNLKP